MISVRRLAATLIPEDGGNPVVLRLQILYNGSLYDAEGNKVEGELSISAVTADDHTYEFQGDDNNDRFTPSALERHTRLVFICVYCAMRTIISMGGSQPALTVFR